MSRKMNLELADVLISLEIVHQGIVSVQRGVEKESWQATQTGVELTFYTSFTLITKKNMPFNFFFKYAGLQSLWCLSMGWVCVCVCASAISHIRHSFCPIFPSTAKLFFTCSWLIYILQHSIDVINIIIDTLSSHFTCEENVKQACERELSGDCWRCTLLSSHCQSWGDVKNSSDVFDKGGATGQNLSHEADVYFNATPKHVGSIVLNCYFGYQQ